jgi:hypothetical protein
MVLEDLKKFCCQNKECSEFGIRGGENIRVRAWYGENKETRLLWCLVCKQRFSEHTGTVFFDARLPKDKIVSILEHAVEGVGVRKTGRLVGVGKDTVSRYVKLAGEHAEQLHDELVAVSPPDRGDTIRRKVGLRLQKGKALRRK